VDGGGRQKTIEKKLRVNEKIRAREIRVIGSDGGQLGIMSPDQALRAAQELGLDLVEVSPDASPPVCRILDYGKYRYQLNKKAQEAKKKQKIIQVKEVKFRPKTDEHDYEFKRNNIIRFLTRGKKVKATVIFRGRENMHRDIGYRILTRIREEVVEFGVVETEPRNEGPFLDMILAPKRWSGPTPAAAPTDQAAPRRRSP
jgi:translation initiation factor IF-3